MELKNLDLRKRSERLNGHWHVLIRCLHVPVQSALSIPLHSFVIIDYV